MKDRIIQVFISFAKGEADMKSLVDRYCEMFEDGWRVDE